MKPEKDFESVDFGDKRLEKRLRQVVEDSRKNVGKSILSSGGERNSAKAFYRLLGNESFDFASMQESVRSATIRRMTGVVLLIQDTSELNLNGHKKTQGLGYCSENVRGIRIHSCIALNTEGVPFGLVGQQYQTRAQPKSELSRSQKMARPIEDKESFRWLEMMEESTKDIPQDIKTVTICDREGDFYGLYTKAAHLGRDFIIRVTHNRNCDNDEKVANKIRKTNACAKVSVNIPRDSRRGTPPRQTEMEIAYCQVSIKRPANIHDNITPKSLTINLVRISELTPPDGHSPIEWILATSLALNNHEDAMTVVEYYIQRWKVERFYFVLKSGCNAEKIQQRTYERILPVLLIYSVIALFIMAVTYLGRMSPDMPCDLFFEDDEWKVLYRVIHKTKIAPSSPYTMAQAISYLGQLGGFKRSPSDGPPGLKSIWQGLCALFQAIDLLMGQV